MPDEAAIERVMRDTGMERMQAIYHLRGRADAQRALNKERRAAEVRIDARRAADQILDAADEMLHALKWIANNTAGAARDVALGAIAKATGE